MDLPLPLTAVLAPFVLNRPARQAIPVVFASPHSGRDYPAAFLAAARLDPLALRKSEDGFVDELFAQVPVHGAPLLAATFPRAYCDPNREQWELDPEMFIEPLPSWVNSTSARVAAGLGTIPRVVASGEAIYRGKLAFAEAEARVRDCWEPFHAALAALIAGTQARFGTCLLIDCHSMPAPHAASGRRVDFVLGDAHGTTCGAAIVRLIEEVLSGLGYRVRRNDPYSGGYITRHYGRPRENVHALQIEITRELYMNERRMDRLPGFARLQRDLESLVSALEGCTSSLAAG
ncbi:MAG: N-formylglutamate amidohydrolase [Acetobacteraceae bacterium]